ncbi:MAG: ubiquinol-cytochrome C chaperone family protein [Alphaproteobacteria bacterium]
MFSRKNDHVPAHIAALYAHLVEQARQPFIYEYWGVVDSVEGRFESISLHVALVIRQLKFLEAHDTAQQLFEWMFKDFDQGLREVGIGDMGIGKHIKRMARHFYGRMANYGAHLENQSTSSSNLREALKKNLLADIDSPYIQDIEAYVYDFAKTLSDLSVNDILSRSWQWPVVRNYGLLAAS